MGVKFEPKGGTESPAATAEAVAETPVEIAQAAPAVAVDDDDTPPFAGATKVVEQQPNEQEVESESVTVTKAAKKAAKKTTKKVTKKADPDPTEPGDAAEPDPSSAEVQETPAAAPVKEVQQVVEKVEMVQPMAHVTVKHASGVETQSLEPAGPPVLKSEPMANVGMNMGYTHGLPGYSNIKFGVSLFMPCKTDEASLQSTFDFVEKWVDEKMQKLRVDLVEGGEDE